MVLLVAKSVEPMVSAWFPEPYVTILVPRSDINGLTRLDEGDLFEAVVVRKDKLKRPSEQAIREPADLRGMRAKDFVLRAGQPVFRDDITRRGTGEANPFWDNDHEVVHFPARPGEPVIRHGEMVDVYLLDLSTGDETLLWPTMTVVGSPWWGQRPQFRGLMIPHSIVRDVRAKVRQATAEGQVFVFRQF